MKLLQFYVDDLIKRAITEDINYIDSTTDLLIDEDDISEAYFVSKADGVLAGIDVAMRVFTLLDDTIEMNIQGRRRYKEGRCYRRVQGSHLRYAEGGAYSAQSFTAYERYCKLHKQVRKGSRGY